MRSHLHDGDLSTRARLREAAIGRFARDGFDVGLRLIAADAGLSAASAIKHFGSKEQLRSACDEYVFATIGAAKREVIADASESAPMALLVQMARQAEYEPLIAYAVRSLGEGGEHARAFFEQVVDDAVAYIADAVAAGLARPSRDERARARYLCAAAFGGLMLELALDPPEEGDLAGAMQRYLDRMTLPHLELYTQGFFTDRRMLDAYLRYVTDPPDAVADDAPRAPA